MSSEISGLLKKLVTRSTRQSENRSAPLPHVRIDVAHLVGPGELIVEHSQLVYIQGKTKQIRLECEQLELILFYGDVQLTPNAMRLVRERQIAVSWLSENGVVLNGRLGSEHSERTLTRILQYQGWNDPVWQIKQAKRIVIDKIKSTQSALRHYQRQGAGFTHCLLTDLDITIQKAEEAVNVDQLRGLEGSVASKWFAEYGKLFSRGWVFSNRNRRPPLDPINALLSLGYMQVYRRMTARLEADGLETMLGVLHEFRAGRQSLACDLMEPLRISAVDRWVVAICQQGIVKSDDFEKVPHGAGFMVQIKKAQFAKVLTRFEEYWHQGLFKHVLDQVVQEYRHSLVDELSEEGARLYKYSKTKAIRTSKGSGEAEDQGFDGF